MQDMCQYTKRDCYIIANKNEESGKFFVINGKIGIILMALRIQHLQKSL